MRQSFRPVTIKDVVQALEPLKQIRRPKGDNEGDAINKPGVYNKLSPEDQEVVDRAEELVAEYVRDGNELKERAIFELNNHGYEAKLNRDQYEPDRLVGDVSIGEWTLDISDASTLDEDE